MNFNPDQTSSKLQIFVSTRPFRTARLRTIPRLRFVATRLPRLGQEIQIVP